MGPGKVHATSTRANEAVKTGAPYTLLARLPRTSSGGATPEKATAGVENESVLG